MGSKNGRAEEPGELRRRAEAIYHKNKAMAASNKGKTAPEDPERTLHELRVHQIELEMQNEELRRAQEELEALRARYFDLYDLAPVGYCTLSEKGLLQEVNLAASAMLGAARETLIGQPLSRYVFTGDQDAYYLHRRQLERTGRPQQAELRLAKRDGSVFWVRLESAREQECRVVISDITARKQDELEKDALNRNLLKARKELQDFLFITSHDMRGPLLNIQGHTLTIAQALNKLANAIEPETLPEEARRAFAETTGEKIADALNYITESGRKMDGILTSLLKVSRLGQAEIRPAALDANSAMRSVLDAMRCQMSEAGASVKTGDLPACTADPVSLDHIFTNLLDNAMKYRDKNRGLVVSVTGERSGASVLYTITDNGRGIKAADLPRIWDLFYSGTEEKTRKSEGIGLTLVRRLAEANSGRIWAESKEGEGSTFFVELPAA